MGVWAIREDWRLAAVRGDHSTVQRLLCEGHPIDGRDRYGQTALMLAARNGHYEVVRLLLDNGADADVTAKFGLSALMLALINGHTAVAGSIINAGADLSLKGGGPPGFDGKTAGDLAEMHGLGEVAEYIAVKQLQSRSQDR